MGYLKIQALGYLGNDVSINTVNGKQVINGSMAYTETWVDRSGERKEKTTWISFSWWTERSKIAPFLKKGSQIFIDGIPEPKAYRTRTGEDVAQIQVKVHTLHLISSSQKDNNENETKNPFKKEHDNSIPF